VCSILQGKNKKLKFRSLDDLRMKTGKAFLPGQKFKDIPPVKAQAKTEKS